MQRTNIYLDEDQLRALRHLAAEHEQSVAALVRQAVDAYLVQHFAEDSSVQQRLDALRERIRSRAHVNPDPVELERDIALAREEVRMDRRAARGY